MATGAPYDRNVTTFRTRPLRGGRVRPALLAPVVVAIVLGILGMHGIDAHGVNSHGSMTHPDAANPATAVMADHKHVAVHSADAPSGGNTSSGDVAGHPSGHVAGTEGMGDVGGMVMLCVAMLAGAALALLTLLVRRGRLPDVWPVLGPAGRVRTPVLAVLRVGTGPPVVWRFSVIRC